MSYLVVQRLGHYTPASYAPYLARGKEAAPALIIYERDIARVADWLVTGDSR